MAQTSELRSQERDGWKWEHYGDLTPPADHLLFLTLQDSLWKLGETILKCSKGTPSIYHKLGIVCIQFFMIKMLHELILNIAIYSKIIYLLWVHESNVFHVNFSGVLVYFKTFHLQILPKLLYTAGTYRQNFSIDVVWGIDQLSTLLYTSFVTQLRIAHIMQSLLFCSSNLHQCTSSSSETQHHCDCIGV